MSIKEKIDILPDHNLLRRYIYPNPPNIVLIKDDGTVCSTCFHLREDEKGLSVDVEHLTTISKAIVDTSKYKLLRLNAGEVRNLGLETEHDPINDNYAHALIKGITKKHSRKLARLASKVPVR